ncbi:hypothetical protein BVI2075_790002 [Burkholderia vietnamiensis]|nr:hypothetical protein BVI2075_790002 [Burkholderia vietnamiensis]
MKRCAGRAQRTVTARAVRLHTEDAAQPLLEHCADARIVTRVSFNDPAQKIQNRDARRRTEMPSQRRGRNYRKPLSGLACSDIRGSARKRPYR